MRKKVLAIDIDGTICVEEPQLRATLSDPKPGAVNAINKLHKAGYIIHLYSTRHSLQWEPTVKWLRKHRVKYHWLILGKTFADYYIDDKCLPFRNNWNEITKTLLGKKPTGGK